MALSLWLDLPRETVCWLCRVHTRGSSSTARRLELRKQREDAGVGDDVEDAGSDVEQAGMTDAAGKSYVSRMSTAVRPQPATIEDLLALSPDVRAELIRGTLVDKPDASSGHAAAQGSTTLRLGERFQRKPGGSHPGGSWFFTELLIQLGKEAFRPDVCAYRRERMAERPNVPIVRLAPDWICEILSPSHEARDRIDKLQSYFRAGVPHYWLMNPEERTLEVFRRTDIGYALVLTARRGERVRAEPFEAVELAVDELFGDDPEEPVA